MRYLYIITFLFLHNFSAMLYSAQQVEIKITKRADERLTVISTNFILQQVPNDAAANIKIFINDLNYSGHFIVSSNNAAIDQASHVDPKINSLNINAWSQFKEDIVVKGLLKKEGQNLILDGYAFDRATGRLVLGNRYSTDLNSSRKLMHLFANELIMTLTGYSGINLQKLVYAKQNGQNKEIFVCDADGYNEVQLTRDQTLILSPHANPKTRELLYTTYKTGFPVIMLHNVNTGKRKVLARFPGLNVSAAFSPDGSKVAMVLSKDGNPDVYIMSINGSDLQRLTNSKSIDESPVFSPDGRKIAFVSSRGGSAQVYEMDLATKKTTRLTTQGSYNTSPDWSPDGRKIAYTHVIKNRGQIFVLDRSTLEIESIVEGEDPAWAMNSRHLAYMGYKNGRKQIFVIDVVTKISRQITQSNQNSLTPAWFL